jgi:hypothetical protein
MHALTYLTLLASAITLALAQPMDIDKRWANCGRDCVEYCHSSDLGIMRKPLCEARCVVHCAISTDGCQAFQMSYVTALP